MKVQENNKLELGTIEMKMMIMIKVKEGIMGSNYKTNSNKINKGKYRNKKTIKLKAKRMLKTELGKFKYQMKK